MTVSSGSAPTAEPSSTSVQPPPLRKLGNYALGRLLGTGHSCRVYLATDSRSGQQYAVKIVEKEKLSDTSKECLSNELTAMNTLRHPNVLRMHEAIQSRTTYTLVLELARKGDLSERITSSPDQRLSEDDARRYFKQLMLGVRYCHSLGIAHRDLKPENLLLDENDCLKISDFGLAALQQQEGVVRLARGACGTPHYMAPEVLRCEEYDGCVADIWSCGVILYVMLTGRFPFDGEGKRQLFREIERAVVVFPRRVSDDAKALVSRLLVADPRQRATLEEVFASSWFRTAFDDAELDGLGNTPPRQSPMDGTVSPSTLSWSTGGDRVPSPFPSDSASVISGNNSSPAPGRCQVLDPQPLAALDGFEVIQRIIAANVKSLASTAATNAAAVPGSRFLSRVTIEEMEKGVLQEFKLQRSPAESALKGIFPGSLGPVTFMIKFTPTAVRGLQLVEILRGRGEAADYAHFVKRVAESVTCGLPSNAKDIVKMAHGTDSLGDACVAS